MQRQALAKALEQVNAASGLLSTLGVPPNSIKCTLGVDGKLGMSIAGLFQAAGLDESDGEDDGAEFDEASLQEQASADEEAARIEELFQDGRRAWTRVREVEEAKFSKRLDDADARVKRMAGGELEKLLRRLEESHDPFAPFPTAPDPKGPFGTGFPQGAKPRSPSPPPDADEMDGD